MFRAMMIASCLALMLGQGFSQAQEMPKPSPEHELLKKYAGTWDATMKMMGQESKCVQTSKMVGDFWVVSHFEGELGGMKFQGMGTNGYDAGKKKYVSSWLDSMSPSIMHMEGTFNKETKTMTAEGTGPGMDGKPAKHKIIETWKSDDEIHMSMSVEQDGKWNEMFTITYKKRKSAGTAK